MEKLKNKLIEIEEQLDILNGDYGSKDQFCIYCKSIHYNGKGGIVHSNTCIIKNIRKIIKDYEK